MMVVDAWFYRGAKSLNFKLYDFIPRQGEKVSLQFSDDNECSLYEIVAVKWTNLKGGHERGNAIVEFDVKKA